MNSLKFVRKSNFFEVSLRITNLNKNLSPCYTRNVCLATCFNIPIHTNDNEFKPQRKSISRAEDCDNFGTLRSSLENSLKFKHSSPTSSLTREKKIIKLKKPRVDESDIFGKLSERNPVWYPHFNEELKDDNDLSDDSVIVKTFGKRYRCPEKYLDEMKRLVKEKKVKDALNLFVDMRRNFVIPLRIHFTFMIGVCGRIGYTEMAFKLLRQMTDRSFQPTAATLTGLFNACAESPFPEYGLKKARLLKEKIETKNWELTQVTYNAMIKAFGKCGDLMTAFKIVDEMAKANITIDDTTYSFLLMSCISNKEAGFTYAVEVCRKMQSKKCKQSIFTFNLLLRATRDCGVGPGEISCLLLQHWSSYIKRPYGFITKETLSKEAVLKLKSGAEHGVSESSESMQNVNNDLGDKKENLNESSDKPELPLYDLQNVGNNTVTTQNSKTLVTSLLLARPINGPEILEIVNIKSPGDRLNLIGGMKGFLEFMFNAKVKPDIKTFTLLLQCLPDNTVDEEELISMLNIYQMKPNIEFCNALIKKRNFRKATEDAQKVLLLMNKYQLSPDIMTFGSLVLGCGTLQRASTFISEMKKFGCSPNIEIAGSLAKQACLRLDFSFMKYVLTLMEENGIKPDERMLTTFEKTLSNARKNIILMEQGKKVDEFYQSKKTLPADFKEFLPFYEEWLKKVKFGAEEHPWSQYKTDIIDRTKKEQFVRSKMSNASL